MGLADFLTRKPKPRSTAAPVRGVEVRATEVPAEPSTEPLAPREQTKVPAVRAAKVRAVPGARRRR